MSNSVLNAEDTIQPPQSPIPQISNHSVFTCKDNVHHLLVPCSAVSIARSWCRGRRCSQGSHEACQCIWLLVIVIAVGAAGDGGVSSTSTHPSSSTAPWCGSLLLLFLNHCEKACRISLWIFVTECSMMRQSKTQWISSQHCLRGCRGTLLQGNMYSLVMRQQSCCW